MASRLKKLQDRSAAILGELKAIRDKADQEERSALNDEESREFDALEKEAKDVDVEVAREKRLQEREKQLRAVPDRNADTQEQKEERDGKTAKKEEIRIERVRYGQLKNFTGPNAEERAFRSGMWCRAVLWGSDKAHRWCQENGIDTRAMGEDSNNKGGAFVPPEMSQTIIDLREIYGVFRRNARRIPMAGDTISIARRQGGVTANFVGENTAVSDSDMALGMVEITARKLAAMTYMSWELAEDAIVDVADMLAGEIAWAFAKKEDECGFMGTGASTYGGIHGIMPRIDDGNHTASIATALAGNIAFSSLDLADFHRVTGKLPLYARNRAKWYISAAGFADSMERLMYAGGGNTTSNIGGGAGLSFLGYPVELVQVMNSTLTDQTSTALLFFGDLMMSSTLGDKRGFEVAVSRDFKFSEQQMTIMGWERFGIANHDLGDTSTPGPVIALKTPGS
jgi:HK97 family phage major capsid protein